MEIIFQLIILFSLFLMELLYFKIAGYFGILDQPNHRSSHSIATIRGGGIIFPISAIIFCLLYGFQYPIFVMGIFLIATISLLDDVFVLNNKIRLTIHVFAILLMFGDLGIFSFPFYFIAIALFISAGIINAYNFMDGINGLTGIYSLIILSSLYYVNQYKVPFISVELLITTILSLIVFIFFNFRGKARCFAGDVGSVSIAFLIIFILGKLIIKTGDYSWILFLLLYGLDTVSTIFFRIIRKENIFKAHRRHFYQFLTNEKRFSYKFVSGSYAVLQLIINIFVILWLPVCGFSVWQIILVGLVLFILLRFYVEGAGTLLETKE